ncbi:MAG: dienelactone hydrolase family protein [Acidimicrobiia bacterium]
MAVLPHEGTFSILYGNYPVPIGAGYRTCYLSRPDEAGRFPVVLLIPSLAGLGSHEKDLSRRLARQGIACLALDLYTEDRYSALSDRTLIADLDEVHEFLDSDDVTWTFSERIGALGIDVGGRLALVTAAIRPWIGGIAVVSTPLTGDEDRQYQVAELLGSISVPVLGLYGAADDLIATETVDEAQNRNQSGQWLLYDAAGHDFLDDGSPEYDNDAAHDAIARLVQFFQAVLPKAIPEDLG